ncbi:hypothetical protein ES319_D05G364500v1 [Gossypium barbadense]|uniref:Interactor of constitutive active ROPs 4 n=2 Tax=Gossypium TaxID=3633 RepID=A0A5J5RRD9_GOSBA|nr:hypothetical protein ES319_D05G364500v1 [Gossypium barbadense]KAB2032311.1 hypothetical protein ES319_D05G364500v1 [Gossypium barbadense]TYG71355.1 hypothetical protein ES288_D05G389700v1 [Gossypium darwinii]TYG71359.1 hypothetical protein ES288_D05G389700v1 [Gossypium darwinii]
MPRSSRGSKVPQRQSPRGSSSDSYPLRHRAITDSSSPKLRECRSRSGTPQSGPLNQKKLGTRIADLETQLGHAQQELKILKHQLDSAEAAKKEAQEQLEKKTKKPKAPQKTHDSKKTHSCSLRDEFPEDNRRETDVFEVPMEKVAMEPKLEVDTTDAIETSTDPTTALEPEKPPSNDLALKDDQINVLKSKLAEKENEVIAYAQENEDLKNQLNEVTTNISTAKAKKAEMSLSLRLVKQELEASKKLAAQLTEKLRSVEGRREALEEEMKKLRVQTEQWRKAADAATAILCGGEETNGRLSNRCSSMDNIHFGGVYTGYVGSLGLDDDDGDGDGFRTEKRKGSGIKMFGDLWKKKGQK